MDETADNSDLGFAYHSGYRHARQVAEEMQGRMGHPARVYPDPAAEALKRVRHGRQGKPMSPAEREAAAQGIDDGLNGRWPRY